MFYLKFAITGLLLLWTFTLTYQKELKLLINEEVIGTSPDSFSIEKYVKPMSEDKRYIMIKITLTDVFYKTYFFVHIIKIWRHDECRRKEKIIRIGPATYNHTTHNNYRVASTIKNNRKPEHLLLYLPDGENKVSSNFTIEITAFFVGNRKTTLPVIKFTVKQEPAVINGRKRSLNVVTSENCELVSVPILRVSASNPALYTLDIKTFLGSKALETVVYINTCYWYLNRKTDKIVDTDKQMKKNSDKRFPGLRFKLDIKPQSNSDIKAHIIFNNVTAVIGNNIGIVMRVTDKKTWMPKEFEMVMPIQWTGEPPQVMTRRPPPQPTDRRVTTVDKDKDKTITNNVVGVSKLQKISTQLKSEVKNSKDKVSVVAAKIKNMKTMTPEQVNDNMMGIAGMAGALFILLTICGICCGKKKKSEEKDAEKDGTSEENKPTDDKKTDDKTADDKKATDDEKAEDKNKSEVNISTEDKGKEKRPDTKKKKPTKKKKKKDSSSDSSDSSSSDSSD